MKEKNIRVFDSEDYEFIKCLRNIGIERKQAMVLAFFRVEEIGTSRGIEMATSATARGEPRNSCLEKSGLY